MPLTIGSKIWEPYFSRVQDSTVAYRRERACLSCNYTIMTAEIPIYQEWLGTYADCCPACFALGIVRSMLTIKRLRQMDPGYLSQGIKKVVSLGGIYRGYRCRNARELPSGEWEGCLQAPGKPTRWTTMEVMGDGSVAADIAVCPICGDDTRCHKKRGKTRGYHALKVAQSHLKVDREKALALWRARHLERKELFEMKLQAYRLNPKKFPEFLAQGSDAIAARARKMQDLEASILRHTVALQRLNVEAALREATADRPESGCSGSHPQSDLPTEPEDGESPTTPQSAGDPPPETDTSHP